MIMHLTTGFLYYCIILVFVLIKIRKRKLIDIFWIIVTLIYLFMVIDVTMFPIPVTWAAVQSDLKFRQPLGSYINLIPNLEMYVLTSRNFLLNILMTMPFGFLVNKLIINNKRLKTTFKYGMLFSISIELLQFIMLLIIGNPRRVDINDVIANTIGALIGLIFYKLFFVISTRLLSYKKN